MAVGDEAVSGEKRRLNEVLTNLYKNKDQRSIKSMEEDIKERLKGMDATQMKEALNDIFPKVLPNIDDRDKVIDDIVKAILNEASVVAEGSSDSGINARLEKELVNYAERLNVKAPYDSEEPGQAQFTRHAEEGVMATFEEAVNNAGLVPEDVEGNLFIIQSNGNGVCNKCTVDLFKPSKSGKVGIFKQFTKRHPNLNIIVSTSENAAKPSGHGALSFVVKNGNVADIIKI